MVLQMLKGTLDTYFIIIILFSKKLSFSKTLQLFFFLANAIDRL